MMEATIVAGGLPVGVCCPDREGDVRNWQDSSTVGVVGCFFVFLGLLLLAGWIALRIGGRAQNSNYLASLMFLKAIISRV
jgi:hypothetical protein